MLTKQQKEKLELLKKECRASFDFDSYLQDETSMYEEMDYPTSDLGKLYTSMTFPRCSPGTVANVDDEVFKLLDHSKRREIILQNIFNRRSLGTILLVGFDIDKLFILDGQHRARILYHESIKRADVPDFIKAIILSGPHTQALCEDIKSYGI